MALTANFVREPISGGDLANWANYLMENVRLGGLGGLTAEVSNVAGAVNVSLGRIGIDDGVTKGVAIVTTAGTVDKSGGTAGVWHALEISVSGTAVPWYLTALAGETDESFMSLTMKGYYDASKTGYYRVASRRVIAFVFLRAALALGRIVNCESGKLGFKGIKIEDYLDSTGAISKKYIANLKQETGDWNMDSTSQLTITLPFKPQKIFRCDVWINADAGSASADYLSPLTAMINPTIAISGGVAELIKSNGQIVLTRFTGGTFDNNQYDATSFNRGYVDIDYES